MSITKTTEIIKRKAGDLGFSSCGISKTRFLKEEEKKFEDWLNNGYQGSMNYLNKNFDKRLDPRKLVNGSKSIISLTYNYYPPKKLVKKNNFIISKYAYGKDYHRILKKKFFNLFFF